MKLVSLGPFKWQSLVDNSFAHIPIKLFFSFLMDPTFLLLRIKSELERNFLNCYLLKQSSVLSVIFQPIAQVKVLLSVAFLR